MATHDVASTVHQSLVAGVLRILAWLLNGLGLDVNEAELSTDESDNGEDDVVQIKMWVTVGPHR